MTARPSDVVDEVEDLALTKADILNPDRLMDVLTVFALEYPEVVQTDRSAGATTKTTSSNNGNTNIQRQGSQDSSENDTYQWVQDVTNFVRNAGMQTAQHLLDAIRTNRKIEEKSTAIRIQRLRGKTIPQTTTTIFDETSPLFRATTRSYLNQFLSRICSDLYDADSFHQVLREFLILYYSSTSARQQQQGLQHPMSTRHHVATSRVSARGASSSSNNDRILQRSSSSDLAHENERAELWIKATNQSLEWVDWLKKAHIETACQLRTTIQQGTLDAKLNAINMPGNNHLRPISSDVVVQAQLVQFLLPIATPIRHLRGDDDDNNNKSLVAAPPITAGRRNHSISGGTAPLLPRRPSPLVASGRNFSSMSSYPSSSVIMMDGSHQRNPLAVITEQEIHEYSYLLGMANPEQAHLILYDIYLQQQLVTDEDDIDDDSGRNQNHQQQWQSAALNLLQNRNLLPPTREFYTYEERQRFLVRPLMSRLFVTVGFMSTIDQDSDDPNHVNGWLRTRFSDRDDNEKYLQEYCQFFMEAHTNQTGAVVATVSDLLLRYYELDRDDYCSEACTLASALCNSAENTHFGIHPRLLEYFTPEEAYENEGYFDTDTLRFRFTDSMSHIFRAIAKHRFLVDNSNTYRLAHCLTDGSFDKTPLWVPTFSFLLQLCLIAYVILELFDVVIGEEDEDGMFSLSNDMIALGLFTSIYSAIQARNGLQQSLSVLNVYQENGAPDGSFPGVLALLDIFVNIVMPIIVVFAGFLVVAVQDNYIDGVLNCAALLFIPEIDDELPAYFNWQAEEIVNAYIVRKVADEVVSKMNFNSVVSRRRRASYIKAGLMPKSGGEDIEFSDIVVTNSRRDKGDEGCTPYEVRPSIDTYGIVSDEGSYYVHHEQQPEKLYITSSITSDCLLQEVKWRYVRDSNLNKGYVERLYLKKLDGTEVLLHQDDAPDDRFFESDSTSRSASNRRSSNHGRKKQPSGDRTDDDWDGEVRGVFIITNFDRDRLITSLRICGSSQNDNERELKYSRRCFKEAMEYYSLWDLAESAKSVLAGSLIRKSSTKSLSMYNKFARILLEYNVLPDYDTYRWERLNNRYDDIVAGNSSSSERRSLCCPWGRR